MRKRLYIPLLFPLFLLPALPSSAQKILQIEKRNSPKTTKIFIGDEIMYRLPNDKTWYTGFITDLLVEEKLIALEDRYLPLDSITALGSYRPWSKAAGTSLFFFGAGWSGMALVGTLTDGNPSTHYRWSDAAVTGAAWGLSYLTPRLFRYRKIKIGKRRRLRLLDLNISPLPD